MKYFDNFTLQEMNLFAGLTSKALHYFVKECCPLGAIEINAKCETCNYKHICCLVYSVDDISKKECTKKILESGESRNYKK